MTELTDGNARITSSSLTKISLLSPSYVIYGMNTLIQTTPWSSLAIPDLNAHEREQKVAIAR